jgi:molybdopterin-containing oxidoreductase family iron-sulfur binding subunit
VTITRKEFLRDFLAMAAATVAGTTATKAMAAAKPEEATESAKAAGPRWGMAIDFQKCRWDEGCNQCIQSCNKAHNVPSIADPAHAVKWIWKEPYKAVFPQQSQWVDPDVTAHPLLLLCNHCSSPACVKVCPTDATWKREDGIVMMDWHRCIGCRYCMAACPYGSRSFNFADPRPSVATINPAFSTREKGVVEKCNFCEERLGRGQGPACAGDCPEHALIFGDLNDPKSEIRTLLRQRYAMQRSPELGAGPAVYYLL